MTKKLKKFEKLILEILIEMEVRGNKLSLYKVSGEYSDK